MRVDIESRVKRANLITRDEQLEQLFGDETSNRLLLDILAKKEGRMTDTRPDQQPTPEKAQRSAPTQPRKRFRPGVALAAFLIVVAVGVAFAIVGNPGSTVAEVEPGPITSFEDIAGTTYQSQLVSGPLFLYFFEDGTFHGDSNRDLVVERPSVIHENRFEGTTVFLHQTKGDCDAPGRTNPDATYEIHLLENGNLQFVEIEDKCAGRSSFFSAELAPAP